MIVVVKPLNMALLSNCDCIRAIGFVEAGWTNQAVANHFNVHLCTIKRLRRRYTATADVKDRPRRGWLSNQGVHFAIQA